MPPVARSCSFAFSLAGPPPAPARETALLATAERDETLGGGRVWSWGPADAPAALLLHGWEGRGAQLGAFVPELRARGWRVLVCDGPAHGDAPGERTYLPEWGGIPPCRRG